MLGARMRRELVLSLLFVVILTGTIVSNTEVPIVEASGTIHTIYIRADGTVDPYDAPIQRRGALYTIFSDITSDGDSIVIQRSNIVVDGDWHEIQGKGIGTGIVLGNVNNVTTRNLDIKNFFVGIRLNSSSSNIISGNTIASNNATGSEGVELGWNSNNNTILENTITGNDNGIAIVSNSDSNVVLRNKVINNYVTGIFLNYSSNNRIDENRIESNGYGIDIYEFCNGTYVFANSITTNTIYGINVENGTHTIYDNNFLNNTQNAKTHSSTSVWDNGIEGNFWSDYAGHDLNLDGIGDKAHIMDTNIQDNYPLMGIFKRYIYDYTWDSAVGRVIEFDIVTNSTAEIIAYNPWELFYVSVSNMTADQTFGFVRICFAHDSFNFPLQAHIDGRDPYYANYTLYDNGTHRWIYLAYEYPAHLIVIPEFASLLILPLFMMATLLAVIIYKRKHTKLTYL